ncbi:MAG: aminoglycoside phosphotransferase family protein [Spirochaetaceae bacterium]|nr:MAG: aminoglycoside phosphotransferase family protein [Spirochaetaceae bacterium]
MRSTSRISVTFDDLSVIVNGSGVGQAFRAAELTGGWFNTIYRVELVDRSSVVVKFAPPAGHAVMRYEQELLETEVTVLTLLRDEGLPVPQVLAQGENYFIMDYVSGQSLETASATVRDAERMAIDHEFGTLSARINRVRGTRFGRFRRDHCARDTWPGAFAAMIEDLLCDAADMNVRLPVTPDEVREYCCKGESELSQVSSPHLVLWDLHPGNIMVKDGRIEAIIDCDRALWGDPLMEHAFRSSARTFDAFFRGYESAGGIDPTGATMRIWLYDLYLALVVAVECAFRGYEPGHVQWANERLKDVLLRRP